MIRHRSTAALRRRGSVVPGAAVRTAATFAIGIFIVACTTSGWPPEDRYMLRSCTSGFERRGVYEVGDGVGRTMTVSEYCTAVVVERRQRINAVMRAVRAP